MSDYTVTVTHPDYEPIVIDETVNWPINKCDACHHLTNVQPRRKPPVCDAESKFVIRIDYTNQQGAEVPLVNADVTIRLLNSSNSHEGTEKTNEDGLITRLIRYDGIYSITGLWLLFIIYSSSLSSLKFMVGGCQIPSPHIGDRIITSGWKGGGSNEIY